MALRTDGIPVTGFTWYSLTDQIDWQYALRFERNQLHSVGRCDYTCPTPSIERDAALCTLHPMLEARDIDSRGRFGAWRYEVGNMDHSVAQGVEWVNRIVLDDRANELTYLAKRGC